MKATQGERHRHKEKDGGEGGCMMTLTSGKGHSICAHCVKSAMDLTVANKERIRAQCGVSFQDGWRGIKGFMGSLRSLICVNDREG